MGADAVDACCPRCSTCLLLCCPKIKPTLLTYQSELVLGALTGPSAGRLRRVRRDPEHDALGGQAGGLR
eukprot:6098810-Alexandrium_andersonii.AAC.1